MASAQWCAAYPLLRLDSPRGLVLTAFMEARPAWLSTLSFLALPLQDTELKTILGHDRESDKAAAGCRARNSGRAARH